MSHKPPHDTGVACVTPNCTEDGIGYGIIVYVTLCEVMGLYGRVGLG
jgi:hypothetical protein